MVHKDMFSSVLFVFVGILSAVIAAPVSQTKESLSSQIKDQEQALETLAAKSQKGVLPQNLQLTRTFSYSNINGAENRQNNFEQKEIDPDRQVITSDLKEKLLESRPSPNSPVEKSFKGSLDVPALGIHKEVTNSGTEAESQELDKTEDSSETKYTVVFTLKAVAEYLARTGEIDEFEERTEDSSETKDTVEFTPKAVAEYLARTGEIDEFEERTEDNSETKDTVEFTPKAVAEYLARTGEIDEFKELLNELVQSSEITSDDAENYEKSVMDEYFNMVQEMPSNKATGEETRSYIPVNKQPVVPSYNGMDQNEVFPLYGYGGQDTSKAAEEARMDMYINYLMNRPVTLDEMISSLMDEWLTRAIISGDPEAEEILSNIVDYVTRDDNPNDEEQVRQILGDIFAEALLEDLTPRIQPQTLPDMSGVLPQSQIGAVNQDVLPAENEEASSSDAVPEKKSETEQDLVQSVKEQDQTEDRPKN